MITLLESMTFWHWLAFGLILLALELLGGAGYLLWIGISALIVGAISSVMPLSWELQWITFSIISLFISWLWWRRQHFSDKQSDANRELNHKQKQLLGHSLIIDDNYELNQSFRVKIGDSTWSAKALSPLIKGQTGIIKEVKGITLYIESE